MHLPCKQAHVGALPTDSTNLRPALPMAILAWPGSRAEAGFVIVVLWATARQANFNCGENEIQASLISSASVGATPTPATISGK